MACHYYARFARRIPGSWPGILRETEDESFPVCVMRVRATFKRLIPHLSACCAFGLDGEVAGRGAVSQALCFLTSPAAQAKRPYTVRRASLSKFRRSVLDGLTLA